MSDYYIKQTVLYKVDAVTESEAWEKIKKGDFLIVKTEFDDKFSSRK